MNDLAQVGAIALLMQGDVSETCRILRSGADLSPDFRDWIARKLEGSVKRPRGQPRKRVSLVHADVLRSYVKVAREAYGSREIALEHVAEALGMSVEKLNRAMYPENPEGPRQRARKASKR